MTKLDPGIVRMIRQVRTRWRLKLLLRGMAYTGSAALALFIVLSFLVSGSGFAPAAVITLRVLGWGAVLAIAVRWLVLPLLRRPSDQQVALYIEEHEPSLRHSLVSALDGDAAASPALLRRTVEQAMQRMRAIDEGRTIERRELNVSGALLAAVAVFALALVAARPATLRYGAEALLNPLAPTAGAQPFPITVEPGDTTIPRGADAIVRARLGGFLAGGADVLVRTGADSLFVRVPMIAPTGDSTIFEVMLFTLRDDAEYFVESGDVRSRVHRISVADLPYVERLALEYRFPAYTNLPPQVVEEGGDIAALRGTTVLVTATPTVPVTGGRIVLDGGDPLPLRLDADGTLSGAIRVQRAGYYHVELDAGSGMIEGSPRYTIDALDDRGPSVRFTKPGRDSRPTSVDEVYVEAQADDDYGVAGMDLIYSVNGGEEQTVSIYSGRALDEVTAGHTLYLEEMDLEAGDLISYYARARDNSAGRPHEITSDIYFLSIRPFGRDYRQAEQAPPGGAAAGGEENGDLAQTQREIIAATFNVTRDQESMSAENRAENLNTIALAQERLREQVGTLAQRMRARGVTEDTAFRRIAEILPQAAEQMANAVQELRAGEPADALPSEQRALQHLQRAEAMYRDVQVAMQQGGGGGGGGAPNAEDLADLFELELDKLRNQYETVQQGQREETQEGVDATLERLRELARRQQQEIERQRRAAAQQSAQGGGSAAAQRQLAEETEEAARQLERLARENNRPDLQETARRLQDAADAMRRAAADQRSGSTAQGQAALERLRDARRRLEQNRANALEQEAEEARREVERLAQEQERVAEGMRGLPGQTGSARGERARELIEQKTEMADDLAELERQLDRMSGEARGQQNDASQELRSAADAIRDGELREMVEWSRNLTQPQAPPELIEEMEQRIAQGIEAVGERLDAARTALEETRADAGAEDAVERAAELARGLESLEVQARGAAEARENAGDQEGQEGEGGGEGAGRGEGSEQGQGGRQTGAPAGGGTPFGGATAGGADSERQLRSAMRERIAEAEALRQELLRRGVEAEQLEDVLSAMRELERSGALTDPETLARLGRDVVDGAKEVEFALRRALLAERDDAPRLRGTGQVAEDFRKLVEEYYRALARQP